MLLYKTQVIRQNWVLAFFFVNLLMIVYAIFLQSHFFHPKSFCVLQKGYTHFFA